MPRNERMPVNDNRVRALLRRGGRKDARKDFFELLKRSVKPVSK